VLSNRDKSRHDKDRGLDGKETETEELRDHAMNGLDDRKSEPVAGFRAAFFFLAKPRRQPVEEARKGDQRKREADAARERPPAMGISPGSDGGAQGAGDEGRRDIDAVQPAACFWREREDRAKAEDDIRLYAEIDRNPRHDEQC
jgi:hypothetical protein